MKHFTIKFLVLILIVFSTRCQKEIIVPNAEQEKLFGTWVWKGSYGGIIGGITADLYDYEKTVCFHRNGICKYYKNGEMVRKVKFTLSLEFSEIHNKEEFFLHSYETGFSFSSIFSKSEENEFKRRIEFGGQDTLSLHHDGTRSKILYVRK
jgi:hypothetical protein